MSKYSWVLVYRLRHSILTTQGGKGGRDLHLSILPIKSVFSQGAILGPHLFFQFFFFSLPI